MGLCFEFQADGSDDDKEERRSRYNQNDRPLPARHDAHVHQCAHVQQLGPGHPPHGRRNVQ